MFFALILTSEKQRSSVSMCPRVLAVQVVPPKSHKTYIVSLVSRLVFPRVVTKLLFPNPNSEISPEIRESVAKAARKLRES